MASLPLPFPFLRLNEWNQEKTLLIWKTISLAACIVGTLSYYSPLEPYLEVPCFGILIPTFIIGYLITISIEILDLFVQEDYMLIEICFNVTGAIGSLACGIYQLYKWITWIIEAAHDPDRDYNLSELALSIALMVHSVSMTALVVHHIQKHRLSSSSEENDISS